MGISAPIAVIAFGLLPLHFMRSFYRHRINTCDCAPKEVKSKLHVESKAFPNPVVGNTGHDEEMHKISSSGELLLPGEDGAKHELDGGRNGHEVKDSDYCARATSNRPTLAYC